MAGWKGLRGVWPAVLVCGGTFAVVQFAISNYRGTFADRRGGGRGIDGGDLHCCFGCGNRGRFGICDARERGGSSLPPIKHGRLASAQRGEIVRAWMPWVILSACVFLVGAAAVSNAARRGQTAARHLRRQPRATPSWWEQPNCADRR